MTQACFELQMDRLSGLKFPPSNLITHWEALKDMPEPLLAAAVEKAQQEVSEFPSPKMLKIFAEQVRARVFPVPPEDVTRGRDLEFPVILGRLPDGTEIRAKRTWNYYCDECSDQGMRAFWCGEIAEGERDRYPWLVRKSCGRAEHAYGHDWSAPCPCAATNPAVQRRLERQTQGARRGEKE